MKNLFFLLLSFLLMGLSQEAFAQASQGGAGATVQTGGTQRANTPVTVSVSSKKGAPATAVTSDAVPGRDRKGMKFQLLDPNGKAVAGGEKRIKYTENDGNVSVDIVGLPAAPKGKKYRLRITTKDNVATNVDL